MNFDEFQSYFSKQLVDTNNLKAPLYYVFYNEEHKAPTTAAIKSNETLEDAFQKLKSLEFKSFVGTKKNLPYFVKQTNKETSV